MSYKLKTLIVFDTNSLRSTEAGGVAYSFFAFGRPFQVIEEFITEKNLTDDIHVAIPTWAIEELKVQKQRQYKDDINEFKKLAQRLSGLPHIPTITLPEEEFDCTGFVQEKANEYLALKKIKLLEIKNEIANTVLKSMMARVMREEIKKKPFAHSGKYKDAGFKDNLIWESLMNFDSLSEFDKVIFLTKDGDYNNCDIEFRDKWNKHIDIEKDENNVLTTIKKDYENYIAERAIHDFAQKEYFRNYLSDKLKIKSEIYIKDEKHKIENFKITDLCKIVDRIPPTDEEDETIVISSEIKIFFTENREKKVQTLNAKTILADDETKDIILTEYDFELI
ncbi:hypothetical protein EZS27_012181 [termite gut metagenome]|uniref:DUF4935 domain-containing protein n=1 Tax=termite gut metagenome TaxID=433724 RepID=A0A5J4S2E6_9ZZZZ